MNANGRRQRQAKNGYNHIALNSGQVQHRLIDRC